MEEKITSKEALELLSGEGITITLPTLINMIRKHHLGFKFANQWHVYKDKLLEHLKRSKEEFSDG